MIRDLKFKETLSGLLRAALVATVYIPLYLTLDSYLQAFETSPNIGSWQLQAGLDLGLLLTLGVSYAPLIVLAHGIGDLWLTPLPISSVMVLQIALSTGAIYGGVSILILRMLGRNGIAFVQTRRGLARLLLGAMTLSLGVPLITALHLVMAGVLAWSELAGVAFQGALGTATGIIAVTPLFLVAVVPFLGNRYLPFDFLENRVLLGRSALRLVLILGFIVGVLWLVLMIPREETFLRFCALSLAILWLGLLAGYKVATGAVFGLTCGFVIVADQLSYGLTESTELQVLMLMCSVNGLFAASTVTEARQARQVGAYREAVLDSVGFVSRGDQWGAGLEELLARLAKVTNASSACLFDCRAVGGKFRPQMSEWIGSRGRVDQGVLTAVREQQFLHAKDDLGEDRICHHRVSELPERVRTVIEASGIRSTVWLPITTEAGLWGGLALDRGCTQKDWEPFEIQALRASAQSLGRVVSHARREEQFRQLTGNLRAVLWRSSPDGCDRYYVSSAYEQIWGRSRKEIRDHPRAWLEAVHRQDADAVVAAFLEGRDYEQEYRIVAPDGSFRWIRERGFPVRTEFGDILQYVGIAEDITTQKKSEDKIQSTTLLLSTLIENLRSGILLEDESGKVRHVNRAFCEIFKISAPRETLRGVDSRVVVSNSESFLDDVETTKRYGIANLGKEMELDNLLFSRDYIPVSLGPGENYHLWQYRDVTQEKQAEQKIRRSLREKEVLLKEIHHRVKNNLQVICSLLSLQSGQIRDEQTFKLFEDSKNRVRAMALIHERLYESADLAKVDFPGYAKHLTDHLMRSCRGDSRRVSLNIQVQPVPMSIDSAVPCGLIINELVSNSLKHAFPNGKKGEILVSLSREEENCRLVIQDNGIGLEKAAAFRDDSSSLGLKLVKSLTEQIGGTISVNGENGASFEIHFPQNGA